MRVGLMQESALRLMTLVMHRISGIVPGQDVFRKIIYAANCQWWQIERKNVVRHCKNDINIFESMTTTE